MKNIPANGGPRTVVVQGGQISAAFFDFGFLILRRRQTPGFRAGNVEGLISEFGILNLQSEIRNLQFTLYASFLRISPARRRRGCLASRYFCSALEDYLY
jgi:hypothetical protein